MASFNIQVQQKVKVSHSIATALRNAINTTLHIENVRLPAGITLLLTDDLQLQQLNRKHLDVDEPTDVLSFPAGETMPGMDEDENYLGDVVISVPYARRRAKEEGHTLKAELQLLTVHGTLHLLGYDHQNPEEKKRMWWAQNVILAQLGAGIVSPTEEETS